jgi:hypothetical protein
MTGWVYAFVTPTMPDYVKFGATTRDPAERLREANACTWHMPDYVMVCAAQVDDPFEVERRIHTFFADRRVDPRREFFHATAEEARALLAMVAKVGGTAVADPMENEVVDAAGVAIGPRREFFRAAEEARVIALVATRIAEQPGANGRATGLARPQPSVTPEPPRADALVLAAQKPEGKLKAWVDANYERVPLREKESGTKLETLYAAYVSMTPPVHPKLLGRNTFASMLNAVYPNIGPHKNGARTVSGIYLLR